MASGFSKNAPFKHNVSKITTKHRTQQGFSLIELSIALTIIGVVVAGGLSLSTSIVDRQAFIETNNQMDEIEVALDAFVSVNNRLPCPANPSLAIDSASFGVEVANCNTTAGNIGDVVEQAGTDGRLVSIGGLPVRTLGLRDRFSADDYGNRYTYAVTEAHTTVAGFSGASAVDGSITVQDGGSNNIVPDASYFIASHGGDGKGAYRYETASNTVACAGGLDAQNCDNADAVFRDARFNRGTVAANFNDDTVRWKQVQLVGAGLGAGASNNLWTETGANLHPNTLTNNVGVGTAAPEGTFEVQSVAAAGLTNVAVLDSNNTGVNSGGALQFRNDSGGYLASIEATEVAGLDGLLTLRVSDDAAQTGVSTAAGASNAVTINKDGLVGIGGASDGFSGITIGAGADTGISITNTNSGMAINATANGGQGVFLGTMTAGGANAAVYESRLQTGNKIGFWARNLAGFGPNILFQGTNEARDETTGTSMVFNNGDDNVGHNIQITSTNSKGIEANISGINSFGADFDISGDNSLGLDVLISGAGNSSTNGFGIRSIATNVTATAFSAFYSTNGTSFNSGCFIGISGQAFGCRGNGIIQGDLNLSNLDVAGNAQIDGDLTVDGTFTNPSDRRLKKDIKALGITSGLQAINALKPVSYHWKDAKKPNEEIGFIAQDVEKIFPHFVHDIGHKIPGSDDTAKGVEYHKLVTPLVLAVQQLSAENDALKARLDALEKKLAK